MEYSTPKEARKAINMMTDSELRGRTFHMRLRDGAVVCNCENQLHTGDEKRPEYIQTRFSSVLLKCAIVQRIWVREDREATS